MYDRFVLKGTAVLRTAKPLAGVNCLETMAQLLYKQEAALQGEVCWWHRCSRNITSSIDSMAVLPYECTEFPIITLDGDAGSTTCQAGLRELSQWTMLSIRTLSGHQPAKLFCSLLCRSEKDMLQEYSRSSTLAKRADGTRASSGRDPSPPSANRTARTPDARELTKVPPTRKSGYVAVLLRA